jgi:hypothetical protein
VQCSVSVGSKGKVPKEGKCPRFPNNAISSVYSALQATRVEIVSWLGGMLSFNVCSAVRV